MTNSTPYRTYHLRVNIKDEDFEAFRGLPAYSERVIHVLQKKWLEFAIHMSVGIFLYFLPSLLFLAGCSSLQVAFIETGSVYNVILFFFVIGFSYLNYYIIVPRFYLHRNFIAWICITGIFTAAVVIMQSLFVTFLENTMPSGPQLLHSDYILILFIAGVIAPVIIQQNMYMEKQDKDMVKMKMASLNARINPHFLFNSLNWVYSLAVHESRQTPDAIIQLSGLMRHLMKDAQSNFVDLKSELNYIRNYLLLQQGRLGNTVSLKYSIPSYNGSLQIAPLVAMSFIENAFKYGVNPDEDSAIDIDISVAGNKFCLQIINNKVSVMNVVGHGLGIENTRQRLQLLYPGLHELEILDHNEIYSVKLSILLQ